MVSRLAAHLTRVFRATAPDPFVIAILLLVLTCVLGLWIGRPPVPDASQASVSARLAGLADSFREPRSGEAFAHMWSLLGFTMQMCLVLVAGSVLASTPLAARVIGALADQPRSGAAAAAMIGLSACLAGVLNWGLGLIVGAVLARRVGESLARRAVPHHYPLLAAAGYFGLMVWHGGLSGSAPLTMTSLAGAARTLPPEVVDRLREAGCAQGVPLTRTLFTAYNAFITIGLIVLVPICLWFLAPRRTEDMLPATGFLPRAGASDPSGEAVEPEPDDGAGIPAWLETTRLVPLVLAGALLAGVWRFVSLRSAWEVGLNEIIAVMLALGLVLHGSARSFVSAVDEAAKGCGGIIVQFPIYAAIMAAMSNTGLTRTLADAAATTDPRWLPLQTFMSASVINLFVPSGGGQWAVQGPIALTAGLERGVEPGVMIMAVAYGDQLTNMLQPFWALPLLAVTRVRARDIVGYTALVMLAGGCWIALGLLVLT
ncbi:MAG: short-chain fatty acid transporter [Phycisphaerae bacterium]|nr:short-chain fatty acid transporter [Phycisphaerae bacterium]